MTKILLIEDSEIVLKGTAAVLHHEGFDVFPADNGEQGLALAIAEVPDLILCDVMMPKVDGYQVLNTLKQNPQTRAIPFVFLTGKDTRSDIRRGMHLGADDYLTKPFTRTELLQTVEAQLRKRAIIRTHYKKYIQQLESFPETNNQYDAVTGLENILYLQEQFDFFTNRLDNYQIKRPGSNFYLPFCLVRIERLERMKQLLSYEFYNQLLVQVVHRLKEKLPPTSQVALIGERELGVLCQPNEERECTAAIAELIISLFETSFNLDNKEIFLDARVGITFYPRSGHSLDELIKGGRLALDNLTSSTSKKYQYLSEYASFDQEKQAFLEAELHYAIIRNQLSVVYQPQIDLKTRQVSGLEALLRWQHPELGSVSPADFIPIAEETGLINAIGDWVLRTAVSQVRYWQAKYNKNIRLAINISAHQLNNPSICHDILRVLAEEDFSPLLLDLEVTESILIEDFQEISKRLKMLQRVGIKIAIDDFGTGYSSFNYTRLFPWDILKIDRCFVNNIHQSPVNAAITKGLIEMSHALGFKVIAEGVENNAELAVLNQLCCDQVQGYFLGRPVSSEILETNLFQARDAVLNG